MQYTMFTAYGISLLIYSRTLEAPFFRSAQGSRNSSGIYKSTMDLILDVVYTHMNPIHFNHPALPIASSRWVDVLCYDTEHGVYGMSTAEELGSKLEHNGVVFNVVLEASEVKLNVFKCHWYLVVWSYVQTCW